MRKEVDWYQWNCAECQRSPTSRHASIRVWQPLPVPQKLYEDIWLDFVKGLPECERFDGIWVVVDWLSKMRHFVPCRSIMDAQGLAEWFLKEVVKVHWLPNPIISYSGPQIATDFCKRLVEGPGIDRRRSMAFHPHTDTQTGRVNAGMAQYFRIFTSHQQNDWLHWLPQTECAAINGTSEVMICSAFFAVTATDPRISCEEAV